MIVQLTGYNRYGLKCGMKLDFECRKILQLIKFVLYIIGAQLDTGMIFKLIHLNTHSFKEAKYV